MKIRCLFFVMMLGFAASLWAQESQMVSKKSLFLRAREALHKSLKNEDYERAATAFDYLKENVSVGAPLELFEEYLVNMELKRFDDAIAIYTDGRRAFMDSAYSKKFEMRFREDDGLNLYLYRHLSPFEKPIADSLIARVDSSDIKQESKDLYRTLLYSEILLGYKTLRSYSSDSVRYMYYIKDTTCAEAFLIAAQNFVQDYPSSKHSSYLKNQIIPFVQKIMNKHRLYRKDPFAHKYYTGGSNLYVYKWLGTLSGEGTDYLNSKMGTSFMIELSLRSWRISLNGYYSYGLITYLKPEFKGTSDGDSEEDVTYGLNLGFTAFDSRYIRVEPFLGYSRTSFESAVNAESSDEFALGTNVDYRFWSTIPRNAFSYLTFSCLLRFKYMVQFGSFKQEGIGNNKKFGTVRHTFALGLGIGDW
ncbi:hypothetical protein [Fibrobacter sp. UWB11]|uniref:hypothetical protein n=1 Tax=Fibrobacter sp. UWB11 TaxID=1896202 RepID=UPI0020C95745|nr:hypothetical protein [Fibrobacter sp. UWB11]